MGEQLWYTWSDSGFGTAIDYRVRAASQGLMDTEGERVRALVSLVGYQLPPDTDLYLPPKEAPRCLAFLRAGSRREPVLIYKTYIGLDGMRRPGNYFSHLLAELPAVFSPRPEGQIEFSAREAIELWGSKSLKDKDSERDLPAGRRDLEQFSLDDLNRNRGSLTVHDVAQVAELFRYVLSAFLTLQKLGEGKRLYIAAPPETVATLIWGLAHALPRTLNLMRTLTFSTFVHNIEDKAAPVIVGTCWLPQYARSGRNTPQDLPLAYYQPNNPYGLAINRYQPERVTPFTPDPPEITKFVEFAVNCFRKNLLEDLNEILNKAEREDITEESEFLQLYASLQEILTKEEVMGFLTNLLSKVETVVERAVLILKKGTFQGPAAEMSQWERLPYEAETLKRENVRRSIILLMKADSSWWQEQGKTLIGKLCQFATRYTEQELTALRTHFISGITSSQKWKKDQGKEVGNQLHRFVPNYTGDDPVTILTTFAERMLDIVRMVQRELTAALFPLAADVGAKVQQAISSDDPTRTFYWAGILAVATPVPVEVDVWASLLQQLSLEGIVCNTAYRQWWIQYGKAKMSTFRSYADQLSDSQLAKAFSAFAKKAATELSRTLAHSDALTAVFWVEVLRISAPPAGEPDVWLSLLQQLWTLMYTPIYQQWWAEQGKAATQQLRGLAESNPQSNFARNLSAFAEGVAKELHIQIVDETLKSGQDQWARIIFLLELLTEAAPAIEPSAWRLLVQKLTPTTHVYEHYGWELRTLLLQMWGSVAVLGNNEYILNSWLNVRWNELGKLLSLKLPKQWYTVAITKALSTPLDIPPRDAVSIVNYHASLFEEVLQELMRTTARQHMAINFFMMLAQQRYSQRIQLLDGMIIASGYQKEVAETLFQVAYLEPDKDVVVLLEHHCKRLLAEYELPPTLINLIRLYLVHFDVSYLQASPTQELLQRLQQRNARLRPELRLPDDLQASVELWGTIVEFIGRPDVSRNWLRDLSHTIRNSRLLLQLAPEAQKKLADVVVPALVERVSLEVDLGRAMDNLGRVLMGSGQGAIGPGLLLLEQMARIAGERYGGERPPVRLVPYIKVVLGEARQLLSPEKEAWIDRCLQVLLKDVDTKTRGMFKNNPALWPDEIFAEWKEYISRDGAAAVQATLTRFREALQNRNISGIVETYDAILDNNKKVTNEERLQLSLAWKFVEAYNADDDTAILDAYNAILGSRFRDFFNFTPAQLERIKQAQSRRQAPPRSTAPISVPYVQGSALIPAKSTTPSGPASNQSYVAVVKGKGIIPAWFELVTNLKYPYVQSRISSLQTKILQLQQPSQHGPDAEKRRRQELKWEKEELKELEKLPSDPEQLRPIVLDDLVDDVLIQDGINEACQQDTTNRQWLDAEPDLPTILTGLRLHWGNSFSQLRSNDSSTSEDIKEAVRIFYRRELFARYLLEVERTQLSNWLKERRRREQAQIIINYEQAGVKPPKDYLAFLKGRR